MNRKEQGFLLLTSHMGDPQRKVLSVAQFRLLAQCVRASEIPNTDGQLTQQELMRMGYNRSSAQRIIELLSEQERLDIYLQEAAKQKCVPLSRITENYPLILRKRLGLDSSGCLWAKGNLSLLHTQMVALVGSRELNEANRAFAQEVGRQAARQGITLVSGNARGADIAAQETCLDCGGQVISVIADELNQHPARKNVLYISEDGYDLPFTTQRALSRNRVIHALGYLTFVAQSDYGFGGTWDGTLRNLKNLWSPVFCFDDGSEACHALTQKGAMPIGLKELHDFSALQSTNMNFIDQ